MASSSKGKQREGKQAQWPGKSGSKHGMQETSTHSKAASGQSSSKSAGRIGASSVASTSRKPYADDEDSEGDESGDYDDDIFHDVDRAESSPDEFAEDLNDSKTATGFAQYMGESDLELDDEQDDASDLDGGSQQDADDMMEMDGRNEDSDSQSETSEPDYEEAQEDLKKVPLEILLKAQRQLKKLNGNVSASRASSSRKSEAPQEDTTESTSSSANQRKGRAEPRRGLATELLSAHAQKTERKHKGFGERPARDSKHAPAEQSSKRAVPRFRQVVEVNKDIRRDPRFDAQTTDKAALPHFDASYSFLSESRREEMAGIKQALNAAKKRKGMVDQNELDAMARELTKLQSKEAEYQRSQRQREVTHEWKKQENEKRRSGKGAFYLKDADRKKLVEAKRMENLSKDKHKLRKIMRRQGSKDKKKSFASAPPQRANVN